MGKGFYIALAVFLLLLLLPFYFYEREGDGSLDLLPGGDASSAQSDRREIYLAQQCYGSSPAQYRTADGGGSGYADAGSVCLPAVSPCVRLPGRSLHGNLRAADSEETFREKLQLTGKITVAGGTSAGGKRRMEIRCDWNKTLVKAAGVW